MVLMPCFFMCSTTAWPITVLDCGRRNTHLSLPGGRPTGEPASCTVPASEAMSLMAAATAVMHEPMIMSTLSSVTKRRALAAPLPGSVASSRMIRLTFSPAMVCGNSLNWFCIGMPRPEPGPVSARLTPMLISARAAVLLRAVMATATRVLMAFMGCLLLGGWERAGKTGNRVGVSCTAP
jgi:hypothetical protein